MKNEDETSQQMKIKIKNKEEFNDAMEDITYNPEKYLIDGEKIELKLPYNNKIMIENHRYKSLSPSLEYIKFNKYAILI